MSNVRYENFKIDDVFNIESSRGIFHACNVVVENKPNGKNHPYVVRTSQNNGMRGYIKADETKLNPGNTISFAQDTAQMFYQTNPYFTGNKVKIMSIKNHELTEGIAQFLIACLRKAFILFGWGQSYDTSVLQQVEISLPVAADGSPDWDYMERRIAELEQERIAELEAYLAAAGLNDYTLTDQEIRTLSLSGFRHDEAADSADAAHNGRKELREFRMGDMFEMLKGQRLTKADMKPGNTVFIGSTVMNNGVTGYIGQDPIFRANAITVSYNGSVGEVFYQEEPFWASDDINVLYLKDRELTPELFGFLGGAIKKAGSVFCYTYKWNLQRMKETMITLPVQTDDAGRAVQDAAKAFHPEGYVPDWEFMETYIKAIEKTVIRDVVKFKDEMIAKTRQVVGTV